MCFSLLYSLILRCSASVCAPDAREVAAQSLPEDLWMQVPGQAGGQLIGQPGSFRGFDFTTERSMLHAHELTAAHAESGMPLDGNFFLCMTLLLRKSHQARILWMVSTFGAQPPISPPACWTLICQCTVYLRSLCHNSVTGRTMAVG